LAGKDGRGEEGQREEVKRGRWDDGTARSGGHQKIIEINKPVSIKELRDELRLRSPNELLELCLRLSRFKKENKELLTYLLFDSSNEQAYIDNVKKEIDEQFLQINRTSPYFIKKGIRKILKILRKYARYSIKKETQVELLIFFCTKLNDFNPPIQKNATLKKLYDHQIVFIRKAIMSLHEDLQYDYGKELDALIHNKNC
jgi:hypothetical protein